MDIWIILEGEKIGPLHDFEVRRKIEAAELPASTPAWHEGLTAWKPLGEIDIFAREFALAAQPPLATAVATPPPLPVETFYLRRFWARWLDLLLYSGIWWLGMWAARQDISAALLNPWVMFLHFVPWFVIETLLLHYFGTTLGKWLLGISVVNKDASLLDLPASLRRALRVLFTGIGFGWSLLAIFCQVLSLFTAKRLGATLWDHVGGHQVRATPLSPHRVVAVVVLFGVALLMQFSVITPSLYELSAKNFPTLPQPYTQNPFWHLPKRSLPPPP
jgi:RDD family/GYF domain 2